MARSQLSDLKKGFRQYFCAIRDCGIHRSKFEPLLFGALLIRKPEDADPDGEIAGDWEVLSDHVSAPCGRYSEHLGEIAYAAFNAITEFASNPPASRCVHRERHSLQRLAGNWINDFSVQCCRPGFNISDYLAGLAEGTGDGRTAARGNRRQEVRQRRVPMTGLRHAGGGYGNRPWRRIRPSGSVEVYNDLLLSKDFVWLPENMNMDREARTRDPGPCRSRNRGVLRE